MGATGAIQLAGAAVSAFGSYQQGQAEKAAAEANAMIYEAQAKNIEEQKKIVASQYRSKANVLRGQATTSAARGGLKISGTTASSISQSIMDLQMDSAYEQYNLTAKKYNAQSDAALQRLKGKNAARAGIYNATTTVLNSIADVASKYWGGSSGSSGTTWAKGQINKIGSWGNTKLSGGTPTTNRQILNSTNSRNLFA